ncbi:predicted pyridoxal phosphate-dependent enzyme apparently involved in regulation of cell [Candidatus Moduliflexus flocculans]|uniref:Predicted pyridoxal phosphate-dependent enzyme apparently involved in regulation of cell n=1 Tax=Candidatus Moduliflexus flocculans TaxID=1499966 RepID=A0A081BMV2_9BACT|nr:predicted pyridoxal phosphate-dependent enzyme apparently involved in regulation of cell [Candidatus Moduliflexus flocculans]
MMNIPFGDAKRQYDAMREELDAAMREVFESGWFILGEQTRRFEEEFAQFCGATYAVGVASGTEAIRLALLASGITAGDEVITVSNTCVPTVAAISAIDAIPVFADIDEQTFTMDPTQLEARISPKTRAIIPVHLYGQCTDMIPLLEIARAHKLLIIEDCAQAHGAMYHGRMAGTMGDAAAFSFYPSKNLGAFGDAGMVITNQEQIARNAKLLRNYGQEMRYIHRIKGYNSRIDELQAAVLHVKLPHLNAWNARRREIALQYHAAFESRGIRCPLEAVGREHVYHLYVLRVPQRDRFQVLLHTKGIQSLIHYPVPVHWQEAYAECRSQGACLPVTERGASEILSIPIFPELTDAEIEYIIQTVIETYEDVS